MKRLVLLALLLSAAYCTNNRPEDRCWPDRDRDHFCEVYGPRQGGEVEERRARR